MKSNGYFNRFYSLVLNYCVSIAYHKVMALLDACPINKSLYIVRVQVVIDIIMHAILLIEECPPVHYWRRNNARQALGVPRLQAKGLPGSGGHCFFSNNALEGILHFISPLLYRKTGYFLRITASRPVRRVFVWLTHLQLIYHLNFTNNRKHVKKYILLTFLISFPQNHEN